jgi:hypothetical protein
MVDLDAAQADLGDALVLDPFLSRHEREDEIEHTAAADIEEVPAADVERAAVALDAPAQSAGDALLLQHDKRGLSRPLLFFITLFRVCNFVMIAGFVALFTAVSW